MGSRSEQETKIPFPPSMEASKFGFGIDTPPAFKFDPTDADIIAYYLLPRALNIYNPHAHAVVDGDPASAPPWEILQRCGKVSHAFFFGPPTDPSQNGGRRSRNVNGGVWQGQKAVEDTVTLLRPGGGELNIRYKRYDLSFCLTKRGRTTGYVMHEYEILSPPLPGTVLTRIKAPKNTKKQQVPDPEQPGPSHQYDAAAMIGNGDGFAGEQDGALYGGGGMVKNDGYYPSPLRYELPLVEYDNNYCAPIQDQPGTSYNYDAAAMNGQGFAGAQFYGGGMVDTSGAYYDPSGYVPECGGGMVDTSGAYYDPSGYVPECGGMVDTSGAYYDPSGYVPECGGGTVDTSGAYYDPSGYVPECGGRMVDTSGAYYDPSGYVPECGGEYSNYYGDYEQWRYQQEQSNHQAGDAALMSAGGEQQAGAPAPCGNSDNGSVMGTDASAHSTISLSDREVEYQQDPSKQYQAGDDAVICADGEGFSGEEQAGALCGNSDKGSVVGTEASPHSTISLCDDGKVEYDDASFYSLFFGNDEALNCEQNDAGDTAIEL